MRPAEDPIPILVMGNSHVAAVMDATGAGAAAEHGLKAHFAALGGGMFQAFYAEGGRLRVREDVARSTPLERLEAMGMRDFDLSRVDVIFLYSTSFLNVQEFIHVPLMARLEEGRWVSDRCVMAGLRDYIETRRLVEYAESLMRESGGARVVVAHPPFRIREHPKLVGLSVPEEWRNAMLEVCDECFSLPGMATLLQPAETIEAVAFTWKSFTEGCTFLSGDVRHKGIDSHMNAAYGALWLRDAAHLARRLAAAVPRAA